MDFPTGYALVQARRAEEARPHLERSLELARGVDADYEVALTLEALGRTGLGAAEAEAESRTILERLPCSRRRSCRCPDSARRP